MSTSKCINLVSCAGPNNNYYMEPMFPGNRDSKINISTQKLRMTSSLP